MESEEFGDITMRFSGANETLHRISPWMTTVAAGLMCGLITYLDEKAGEAVSLGVLFVPFVSGVSWLVGLGIAVALSLFCALLPFAFGQGLFGEGGVPFAAFWEALNQFSFLTLFAISVWALKQSRIRERRLARTDSLTGLANRTLLLERVEAELNRGKRFQSPLTLAFLDCDHFKEVNDTRGHQEGDALLKMIASQLCEGLRSYDLAARWGGDEFVVLLPETYAAAGRLVVERLRSQLQSAVAGQSSSVTFSIGVVTYSGSSDEEDASENKTPSPSQFVRAADELMYTVKHSTKNNVAYGTFDGRTQTVG